MNCHFNARINAIFFNKEPQKRINGYSPYIYHRDNDALHGTATPNAWNEFRRWKLLAKSSKPYKCHRGTINL